jgi:hypothetical protein
MLKFLMRTDQGEWPEPAEWKKKRLPEPQRQPVGSMPKRQALSGGPATSSASSSRSLVRYPTMAALVVTDLAEAIQQQTKNAYIFVKARLAF